MHIVLLYYNPLKNVLLWSAMRDKSVNTDDCRGAMYAFRRWQSRNVSNCSSRFIHYTFVPRNVLTIQRCNRFTLVGDIKCEMTSLSHLSSSLHKLMRLTPSRKAG